MIDLSKCTGRIITLVCNHDTRVGPMLCGECARESEASLIVRMRRLFEKHFRASEELYLRLITGVLESKEVEGMRCQECVTMGFRSVITKGWGKPCNSGYTGCYINKHGNHISYETDDTPYKCTQGHRWREAVKS